MHQLIDLTSPFKTRATKWLVLGISWMIKSSLLISSCSAPYMCFLNSLALLIFLIWSCPTPFHRPHISHQMRILFPQSYTHTIHVALVTPEWEEVEAVWGRVHHEQILYTLVIYSAILAALERLVEFLYSYSLQRKAEENYTVWKHIQNLVNHITKCRVIPWSTLVLSGPETPVSALA